MVLILDVVYDLGSKKGGFSSTGLNLEIFMYQSIRSYILKMLCILHAIVTLLFMKIKCLDPKVYYVRHSVS